MKINTMFYFQNLQNFKKLMNIRLYFGHYHFPEYSKFTNIFFNIYSLVYSVSIFFIYFCYYPRPLDFIYKITYTYTMVEVICNNLLSFVSRGKYLKKLYILIENVNTKLNLKKNRVTISIYVFIFVCVTFRIYITVRYSPFSLKDFRTWTTTFTFIGLCVNYVSKILVFDIIYNLMKAVRIRFESRFMNVNVIGQTRVRYKIENIKKCLSAYVELHNFIKNIDFEIKTWVKNLHKMFCIYNTILIY